jgi:hypothetical protein
VEQAGVRVHHGLHAVEALEKVDVPPSAAELSVRDAGKTDRLLSGNRLSYGAILDGAERLGGDLTLPGFGTRLVECSGSQQTADLIGTERRFRFERHERSHGSVRLKADLLLNTPFALSVVA